MSQTMAALGRLFKSPEYQQMLRDAERREAESHRKLLELWNNLQPASSQSPTTSTDEAKDESAGTSCKHPGAVFCGHDCDCNDPEAHMCAYPGCDCVGVHCKASSQP